mmetsp:Transcript_23922/g.75807  ORF Transcript_23922/g.75807 Transcript_23922/m.75807 type:complete len:225 (-) Transcript_23922:112-786(-)
MGGARGLPGPEDGPGREVPAAAELGDAHERVPAGEVPGDLPAGLARLHRPPRAELPPGRAGCVPPPRLPGRGAPAVWPQPRGARPPRALGGGARREPAARHARGAPRPAGRLGGGGPRGGGRARPRCVPPDPRRAGGPQAALRRPAFRGRARRQRRALRGTGARGAVRGRLLRGQPPRRSWPHPRGKGAGPPLHPWRLHAQRGGSRGGARRGRHRAVPRGAPVA